MQFNKQSYGFHTEKEAIMRKILYDFAMSVTENKSFDFLAYENALNTHYSFILDDLKRFFERVEEECLKENEKNLESNCLTQVISIIMEMNDFFTPYLKLPHYKRDNYGVYCDNNDLFFSQYYHIYNKDDDKALIFCHSYRDGKNQNEFEMECILNSNDKDFSFNDGLLTMMKKNPHHYYENILFQINKFVKEYYQICFNVFKKNPRFINLL